MDTTFKAKANSLERSWSSKDKLKTTIEIYKVKSLWLMSTITKDKPNCLKSITSKSIYLQYL